LLAILFQCAVDGIQEIANTPQYYNATWIIFALFAFFAVNKIFQNSSIPKSITRAVVGIFAVSLLFIVVSKAIDIHEDSGIRKDNYGTALSNQIAAVNQLHQFSADSPREMDFPQWATYPIALDVLEKLFPPAPGPKPNAALWIGYRNMSAADAAIAVIPLSPQSPSSPR
jgi:hypothetical protein